jgi:hemolysin activation/secretion protein
LLVEAYFSGTKFSNNFFGYGNETVNDDKTLGKDYNRARTRQTNFNAGFEYHKFKIKALFESFEIQQMNDRFFTPANVDPAVFEHQNYVGTEASIMYLNRDTEDFSTKGLYASAKAGWKINTDNSDNNFGYFVGKVGLEDKLTNSGNLVFQTVAEGRVILGDNYYFYHSSFLGGNNGLRGYRNERFSGKSSLYDSSNLKLKVASFKTGLIPIDFGLYGGFDVGRVWIEDDPSKKWHTSQGGGIWLGGLSSLSLQAAYFNSDEGNIVFIGFNFKY